MFDHLVGVLQQQWFTHNEAIIYITLIQYGGGTWWNLARITDINRATVYTALAEMKKKWRIHTLIKNDVITFYAIDYKTLVGDIERKYLASQEALGEFEAIAHQFTHQKAKLEYYDGEEGVKKAFEMTLQSSTPIYAFLTMQDFNKKLEHRLVQEYRPARVKKKITAYCICDYAEENIDYQNQDALFLKETKIINSSDFDLSGEINIFDNDKVMHVYADKGVYYATMHTSESYYRTMYSLFQQIRKIAS